MTALYDELMARALVWPAPLSKCQPAPILVIQGTSFWDVSRRLSGADVDDAADLLRMIEEKTRQSLLDAI